jgi:hypothetical protein
VTEQNNEPGDRSWSSPPPGGNDSSATIDGFAFSLKRHPEIVIVAAFVGGLLLAMLLKRLGR